MCAPHIGDLQVDAPDDEEVGRLFTHELRVVLKECLAVLIPPYHTELLYKFLILLCVFCLKVGIISVNNVNFPLSTLVFRFASKNIYNCA